MQSSSEIPSSQGADNSAQFSLGKMCEIVEHINSTSTPIQHNQIQKLLEEKEEKEEERHQDEEEKKLTLQEKENVPSPLSWTQLYSPKKPAYLDPVLVSLLETKRRTPLRSPTVLF